MHDQEEVTPGFRRLMPYLLVGGFCSWMVIAFTVFHLLVFFQEWRYADGTERFGDAVLDTRHGWMEIRMPITENTPPGQRAWIKPDYETHMGRRRMNGFRIKKRLW